MFVASPGAIMMYIYCMEGADFMAKESLKERSYQYIREGILTLRYPPGSFLDEAHLVEEIGASRTPIREALNKLEQENLVRIFPKRGVLVCDLTLADLNEVYEVRLLLEPYIIRTYASALPREALLAARERIGGQQAEDINDADDQLHQMLADSCANSYVRAMMGRIYYQNHRIRILSDRKNHHRRPDTGSEHLAIVDHLLAGDSAAAADAMTAHLLNSKEAAIAAMLSSGAPGVK